MSRLALLSALLCPALTTACRYLTEVPVEAPAPPPPAPHAVEAPPPADLPDLSGKWEYRGLTPFPAPNLYTFEQVERNSLGPGRYSVRSTQELRSADRGARLGDVVRTGTVRFGAHEACTTWTQVDLDLEPWLDTLPLRQTVTRRYEVHDEECVPVERYAADRVEYAKGSIRWAETRHVPDWRAPPGTPARGGAH